MSLKIFITGTDTEVGKTYVTVGLLKKLTQLGFSTIGIKPIATGGLKVNNCLFNEDAIALQQASSVKIDYALINPFVFEQPIAPHLAAEQSNTKLSLHEIIKRLSPTLLHPCDIQLIEGVGGWSVPLNNDETVADFVCHYQFPVILVVGIKLGCINHTILTYQAIKRCNLSMVGWVANCIDKELMQVDGIIQSIQNWINIPLLGIIPYAGKVENYLSIDVSPDEKCSIEPSSVLTIK